MSNCSICNTPIKGIKVTNGKGGFDHRHCYEKQHPPLEAETLWQVARGCSDPTLAAKVVAEMVDDETASKIVAEFNRRVLINWKRRCEP